MSNVKSYDTVADLAVVKKQNELTEFMQGSDRWKQFMSKLPAMQQKQIAYDLFAYVNDNAAVVVKMDSNDFMKQVVKCYSRGLTLRDGDAYILPFTKGGKDGDDGEKSNSGAATLVPGYKGVVRLATETGFFKYFDCVSIIAESILSFDYRKNIPVFRQDYIPKGTEKVIGYYSMFETHDGLVREIYRSVEYFKDFALKKSPSCKAGKNKSAGLRGPWADDFDAMCRKTGLKELTKLAPRVQHGESASYENFQALVDMDEDRPDYIDSDGVATLPSKPLTTAQTALAKPQANSQAVVPQPPQLPLKPTMPSQSETRAQPQCVDCGVACDTAVKEYSERLYGAIYCRACQKKHTKIS